MTTQEALEAIFQNTVENARAGCCACGREATALLTYGTPHTCKGHTCRATIDAAAEFGVAAAQEVQRQVRLYGPVDAAFRVEATINRLREKTKK